MATIGFIGLGNMGAPMAANLVKAQHHVTGFDLVATATAALAEKGGHPAASTIDAVAAGDIVITMLPAGPQVRAVYLGPDGIIAHARPDALLIDCSTIDVETARLVTAAAAEKGLQMLDAPVSGGVIGAEAATLTFMVGGEVAAFARADPQGPGAIHQDRVDVSGTQAVRILRSAFAGDHLAGAGVDAEEAGHRGGPDRSILLLGQSEHGVEGERRHGRRSDPFELRRPHGTQAPRGALDGGVQKRPPVPGAFEGHGDLPARQAS
jgi:hypothetical protein